MTSKIESYDFGKMIVGGRAYTSDLIVFPDRVKGNWWRREGHKLHIEDLDEILEAKPKLLIVGTGYSGLVEIPKETEDFIRFKGVELIAKPTREAVELYNELHVSKRVIAAFHLTC